MWTAASDVAPPQLSVWTVMIQKYKVVLLRHGESVWNQETRFTGWTDVDLSEKGRQEATNAAAILKQQGYSFDVVFTSVLKRAIRTAWIILDEMDLMWIPVLCDWRLNERHYGALQGLNKAETAANYGEEQVKLWRRGYAVRPPALDPNDARSPARDPRYRDLNKTQPPLTESLEDTAARLLPCWHERIAPSIRAGKQVLISAHGNSLRGLVQHLENFSRDAVVDLEIPTGVPLVEELDDELRSIRHSYLGYPVLRDAINPPRQS